MHTIFAPITANAKSAVLIIRISGPQTKKCLNYLGIKKELLPRQATFAKIIDPKNQEIIDWALITFFNQPHSFTGEDVAEIALHNSIYIIKKITELLLEFDDVKIAEAGEFSKRAFLNNKIDLLQAEAIVDLINSETKAQHHQALQQMHGDLGKIYEDWRTRLIKITANIEAYIDFPDEDLPQDIIADLEDRVKSLIAEIKEHLNDNKRGEKIREGLQLAIIGPPNVGKSSLINYLAKSDVAIVSEFAGTTRDVVSTHLTIADVPVVISDTAGIRVTEDVIEKEGIKRALEKAKTADLKILLLDVSDTKDFPKDFPGDLIDENTIVVINKIDLKNIPSPNINSSAILISLKEKINLEELLNQLAKKVKNLTPSSNQSPITRARYRKALEWSVENLSQFNLNKNIELAAEDLRLAIREIGAITGKVNVDDILDVIFSGFCIGK